MGAAAEDTSLRQLRDKSKIVGKPIPFDPFQGVLPTLVVQSVFLGNLSARSMAKAP